MHQLYQGFFFKRNSWLVVSAENFKIEYFLKKIFNSHVHVLVDNDTMKILKEIEFLNSHILENIVQGKPCQNISVSDFLTGRIQI